MAIVKVTREMVEAALREVDWAAQDRLTDEDIRQQIADNPDAAPDGSTPEVIAMHARWVRRLAVRTRPR